MQHIDLDQMDRAELVELGKRVDKAISTYDKRKRQEAMAAAEAAAREYGLSLADLTSAPGKARTVHPPRYRHPENPEMTWSGRGRQPRWIKDALNEGRSMDEFLIQK